MFDEMPAAPPAAKAEAEVATPTPALARFQSCRWQAKPDHATPYCSHRDVQPYAGTTGFNAEAWCPECEFYKLRRTARKPRRDDDYDY
jgi:hypothetical protein